MATLTLNLPAELVEELRHTAERAGQPVDAIVARLLAEQLQVSYQHPQVVLAPLGEREQVRAALREAGLWAELGAEAQRLATEATGTLEEVEAAFARAEGQSLSEIVRELRGPKV